MPFIITTASSPAGYSARPYFNVSFSGTLHQLTYSGSELTIAGQNVSGVGNRPYPARYGHQLTEANTTSPATTAGLPAESASIPDGRFLTVRTLPDDSGLYAASALVQTPYTGLTTPTGIGACHTPFSAFPELVNAQTPLVIDSSAPWVPDVGYPESIVWDDTNFRFNITWDLSAALLTPKLNGYFTVDTAYEIASVPSSFTANCHYDPTHVVIGGVSLNNGLPVPSPLVAGLPSQSQISTDWQLNTRVLKDMKATGQQGLGTPVRGADGTIEGWAFLAPLSDYGACRYRRESFVHWSGDLFSANTTNHPSTYLPAAALTEPGQWFAASTDIPTFLGSVEVRVAFAAVFHAPSAPGDPPLYTLPSTWKLVTNNGLGTLVTLASGAVSSGSARVGGTSIASNYGTPPFSSGPYPDPLGFDMHVVRYWFCTDAVIDLAAIVSPTAHVVLQVSPAVDTASYTPQLDLFGIVTPKKNFPYTPGFAASGPGTFLPGLMRRYPVNRPA